MRQIETQVPQCTFHSAVDSAKAESTTADLTVSTTSEMCTEEHTYQDAAHRVDGDAVHPDAICATWLLAFSLHTISALCLYRNKGLHIYSTRKRYDFIAAPCFFASRGAGNEAISHVRVSRYLVGLGVGTHLRYQCLFRRTIGRNCRINGRAHQLVSSHHKGPRTPIGSKSGRRREASTVGERWMDIGWDVKKALLRALNTLGCIQFPDTHSLI